MKIKDFFEKIKDDFLANSRIFGSWFKKKVGGQAVLGRQAL